MASTCPCVQPTRNFEYHIIAVEVYLSVHICWLCCTLYWVFSYRHYSFCVCKALLIKQSPASFVLCNVGHCGALHEGKGLATIGQNQVPGSWRADHEPVCHHYKVGMILLIQLTIGEKWLRDLTAKHTKRCKYGRRGCHMLCSVFIYAYLWNNGVHCWPYTLSVYMYTVYMWVCTCTCILCTCTCNYPTRGDGH